MLSLFANDMIVYVENLKEAIKTKQTKTPRIMSSANLKDI